MGISHILLHLIGNGNPPRQERIICYLLIKEPTRSEAYLHVTVNFNFFEIFSRLFN